MKIFPAIDLFEGKAVRLLRGDYGQMTVYSENPVEVAKSFAEAGATALHLVDLEGARSGGTPNIELIKRIISESGLETEVGGGIRSEAVVKAYLDAGAARVILGTVAVQDPDFTRDMLAKYGAKIAVGVDVKDGFVATNGWLTITDSNCFSFCSELADCGVQTIICTDISKDGAMSGTNLPLYRDLKNRFNLNIIASGGVTDLDDVRALRDMDVYGAILGKAIYTGGINLAEAVREVAE